MRRGDEEFTAVAGDEFAVEPGVVHQMWAGDDGAGFRWRTSPALRTDQSTCDTWECGDDNDWKPSPQQTLEVMSGYGDEFRLA